MPQFLEVEIVFRLFQLLFDRDQLTAFPYMVPEQSRQVQKSARNIVFVLQHGHHANGVQSVI